MTEDTYEPRKREDTFSGPYSKLGPLRRGDEPGIYYRCCGWGPLDPLVCPSKDELKEKGKKLSDFG